MWYFGMMQQQYNAALLVPSCHHSWRRRCSAGGGRSCWVEGMTINGFMGAAWHTMLPAAPWRHTLLLVLTHGRWPVTRVLQYYLVSGAVYQQQQQPSAWMAAVLQAAG